MIPHEPPPRPTKKTKHVRQGRHLYKLRMARHGKADLAPNSWVKVRVRRSCWVCSCERRGGNHEEVVVIVCSHNHVNPVNASGGRLSGSRDWRSAEGRAIWELPCFTSSSALSSPVHNLASSEPTICHYRTSTFQYNYSRIITPWGINPHKRL